MTHAERLRLERARRRLLGICADCLSPVWAGSSRCRTHLLKGREASRRAKNCQPYDSTIWRGGRPPQECRALGTEPEA